MGIVPIWGFQLMVAIALSFLFRLNKALVVIAANISIPPMIPIILFLSHLTGALWMRDKAQHISFSLDITYAQFGNSLLQYILGATTLAIGAGLIAGLLTYVALRIFRKRHD